MASQLQPHLVLQRFVPHILPMKISRLAWLCFLLVALPIALAAQAKPANRGGLEYIFANLELVRIDGDQYLSLDVMVSSPDANQRLGTGILLINYNPQVFGNSVRLNSNVAVSRGSFISTSPFPFYNLVVNDNTNTRLAVTFEYTVPPGYGSLLTAVPQHLVNIKFKVQNAGFYSGLSFQQNLMQYQQYMDNNATLFSPVVASDTENVMLPVQPANLCLTINGGVVYLTWQQIDGCAYTVYSALDPEAEVWQEEASGLSGPAWNTGVEVARKFYRVTAIGLPG